MRKRSGALRILQKGVRVCYCLDCGGCGSKQDQKKKINMCLERNSTKKSGVISFLFTSTRVREWLSRECSSESTERERGESEGVCIGKKKRELHVADTNQGGASRSDQQRLRLLRTRAAELR